MVGLAGSSRTAGILNHALLSRVPSLGFDDPFLCLKKRIKWQKCLFSKSQSPELVVHVVSRWTRPHRLRGIAQCQTKRPRITRFLENNQPVARG